MTDFEVHIDLDGRIHPIGMARGAIASEARRPSFFEYDGARLEEPDRFSLEPALALTRGAFAPSAGPATFRSISDSAPDTWGRRLMQRAERRQAEREGRAVRTLTESDYLLGVADETRLGALRLRWVGDEVFQAPTRDGVPALIELGRLLQITGRILRDEETDEDMQLIFAPGSSSAGRRRRSSTNMVASPSPSFRRRPTTTAWRPGRRSRYGWPVRQVSPLPARADRCRRKRGHAVAAFRS
ncbi:hypothetical protein HNQ71_006844 [Mesorhizobium sangaii]|uniref:HipA N-terminal subdomain 1 domain-containing protein n=1 Tax=Mesorhizobium sangaii TaxID=505389 RepID=A0A841PZ04_9HYPH|nr:hypothetical protein [Mesorhizobium sangaii]